MFPIGFYVLIFTYIIALLLPMTHYPAHFVACASMVCLLAIEESARVLLMGLKQLKSRDMRFHSALEATFHRLYGSRCYLERNTRVDWGVVIRLLE